MKGWGELIDLNFKSGMNEKVVSFNVGINSLSSDGLSISTLSKRFELICIPPIEVPPFFIIQVSRQTC